MFIPESILLPLVDDRYKLYINNRKNINVIKNFLVKIYKPIRYDIYEIL
jgi:hypothetical protein